MPATEAAYSVKASDWKFVCALYGLDGETSAQATLKSLEDGSIVSTAGYTASTTSFDFLVEENGSYLITISMGEEILSEHAVEVTDAAGFYLVNMRS